MSKLTEAQENLIKGLSAAELAGLLFLMYKETAEQLKAKNEELKAENAKLKKEAEEGVALLTEALYLVEKYAPKPPMWKD